MGEQGPNNAILARRALLAAGGTAGVGLVASGCRSDADDSGKEGGSGGSHKAGDFPKTPKYNFVFINHVTTNPFFTATQYGIADASALLNTKYQWTGSKDSVVSEMVNAMNSAINSNPDGIAVSVVDPKAFNKPIKKALDKGIPVVAYNANGKVGESNPSMAYVGQDLYQIGVEMGKKIAKLVGKGKVAMFIATPGELNIQPRLDGAKEGIKKSGADIEVKEVKTGAKVNDELNRIDSYYQGHKDVKGMFAVDAGSTQGVGQVMKKYKLHDKGIKAGGFDLLTKTLKNVKDKNLDFTIDQQAYLQGFQPVVQLYLYNISGGLVVPTDTDTSLKFVTPENVDPYLEDDTRYEGSTKKQHVLKRPSKVETG